MWRSTQTSLTHSLFYEYRRCDGTNNDWNLIYDLTKKKKKAVPAPIFTKLKTIIKFLCKTAVANFPLNLMTNIKKIRLNFH